MKGADPSWVVVEETEEVDAAIFVGLAEGVGRGRWGFRSLDRMPRSRSVGRRIVFVLQHFFNIFQNLQY